MRPLYEMRPARIANEAQVIELFRRREHIWRMRIAAATRSRIGGRAALSLVLVAATCALPLAADQAPPETAAAFERYIRAKEAAGAGTVADAGRFLKIDALPEAERNRAYAQLRNSEILIEGDATGGATPASVPGGLIHDWLGIVFVPSISLRQALAALEDYDHDSDYYRPQVLKSKLVERSGDDFRVFLRLRETHGITVVLDTEYEIRYTQLDATHAYSRSYSTRVVEVEHPGETGEREFSPADDRGLLWRLDSFWRFREADGGVYIQCNAVSLTRDVPAGLGWLVRPFIEKIPQESLSFTLDATRKALAGRFGAAPASAR
jgi:hypothetical protein